MLSREQRNPLSEWWWTVDRLQLGAIIALILCGIILSLAASPPVATRIGLDPFHFFNRHVLFLLPSFVVMIGVSFLSPRQIRRTALIVFVISIALIVATLLIGPEVKGSRRWITLIGVNIQASESAKPAFVVLAAWLFAESTRRPEMPATSMALVLLMMLVSLLVMEPDFGQTMLILMVWGALFFIAGMSDLRVDSANSHEMRITKAGLTNSEGWMLMPASTIQRRAPFTSAPNTSVAAVSPRHTMKTTSAVRLIWRGARNEVAIITTSDGARNIA